MADGRRQLLLQEPIANVGYIDTEHPVLQRALVHDRAEDTLPGRGARTLIQLGELCPRLGIFERRHCHQEWHAAKNSPLNGMREHVAMNNNNASRLAISAQLRHELPP